MACENDPKVITIVSEFALNTSNHNGLNALSGDKYNLYTMVFPEFNIKGQLQYSPSSIEH